MDRLLRSLWFGANGQADRRRGKGGLAYGMTMVDLNNLGYKEEPFVLANDVAQVFYVKDMSTKPRKKKISKRIHHTMSQSAT
jgi:hypothetical protein